MAESTCNKYKRSLAKENADLVAIIERLAAKKRLRLSLNEKSKPTPREQFSFLSSEDVEAVKKSIIQKKTKECTDRFVRGTDVALAATNNQKIFC